MSGSLRAHASARVVRVIAVSPGDVPRERKRLAVVIEELNRNLAREMGFELRLWRWETDASPGLHLEGTQGLIDEAMRMEDADVVVGIFLNRLGTPTRSAGSGTAHELRRAWDLWKNHGRPQVFVYYCQRKTRLRTSAEAAQLLALLKFREATPSEQLWWEYDTATAFERDVRQHISGYLHKLAKPPADEPEHVPSITRFMALWEPMLSGREVVPKSDDDTEGTLGAFEKLTEDQKDRIAGAIQELPEREKLVIALTYYEGLPTKEVASVLGIAPVAVDQLRQRAVSRMRELLQEPPKA